MQFITEYIRNETSVVFRQSKNGKIELYFCDINNRLRLSTDKKDYILMTNDEYDEMNNKINVLEEKIEKLRDMILYMPPGGNQGYQETKEHFDNLVREKSKN